MNRVELDQGEIERPLAGKNCRPGERYQLTAKEKYGRQRQKKLLEGYWLIAHRGRHRTFRTERHSVGEQSWMRLVLCSGGEVSTENSIDPNLACVLQETCRDGAAHELQKAGKSHRVDSESPADAGT